MVKKDILDLIDNFDRETWHYPDLGDDGLFNDFQYVYSIEKEMKDVNEANLKYLYDKLLAIIGILRLKYGFQSMLISTNPELEDLKKLIDNIPLDR